MSKSKNSGYVDNVVVLGSTQLALYHGYGRFTWPSETTANKNYLTRVSDDRKSAACDCDNLPELSAGEQCKHGKAAIDVVKNYIDVKNAWEKPFRFPPYQGKSETSTRAKSPTAKYYDKARRLPAPKYSRPDGLAHRSAEQAGRREAPSRVPDFLDQLMRGTDSTLREIERTERLNDRKARGFETIGAGAPGRPLSQRLYTVVMRHAYRSNMDQAARFAEDGQAGMHIGETPSEGSIGNYFHQTAVLLGLHLWLAQTARAVARLARIGIMDSTAFSTSIVEDWLESGHGTKTIRFTSSWLKAHVLSDAATNIIGAIVPTANYGISADVAMVDDLLSLMRNAGWDISVLLGDKAYFDQKVRNWCEANGIKFFVPLKGKLTEQTINDWNRHNGCVDEKELFKYIYRFRTKIESVFSAWKRMFQPEAHTRQSKHFGKRESGLSLSQEIELLAYAVAYNLHRLAVLESILKQRIDFARGIYFDPMPDEWISPESEVPSLYTAPDLLKKAA